MGYEEYGAAELKEKFLKPADRFDIEMVRGLIEKQEVRLVHERPRKKDPSFVAAGEPVRSCIRVQPEAGKDRLDPLLYLPAS